MNLSADDINLGMLLPMRAGHSIAGNQQSIVSGFSEIITDAVANRLRYDYSPTGVSFLADETDFTIGESILASFEIPACGICETVVTVTRVEIRQAEASVPW